MAKAAANHLEQLAHRYIGGLAHVHTLLSNHKGHFESDQTVTSLLAALIDAGLAGQPDSPIKYLMINEHASNPVRPHALGRFSLRERALVRERWRVRSLGVPVWHGFEASLLPDGHTDLTGRLAKNAALIIASRHQLPEPWQSDPAAIKELFEAACENPVIDVIGHPARNIENILNVDWPRVFAAARDSGTAIEVNLNSFPTPTSDPTRQAFWTTWLAQLAGSGAQVFLGTDLHNTEQVRRFINDVRTLDQPNDDTNRLTYSLRALEKSEISPENVVNADYERFKTWLELDKTRRKPHN